MIIRKTDGQLQLTITGSTSFLPFLKYIIDVISAAFSVVIVLPK